MLRLTQKMVHLELQLPVYTVWSCVIIQRFLHPLVTVRAGLLCLHHPFKQTADLQYKLYISDIYIPI